MIDLIRKLFGSCPAPVRRLLEKINRGRVVRRKLGRLSGGRHFYASPEASLIWAYPWAVGNVDPQIDSFCRKFISPGAQVWDFGANVGLFSFTAAFFAGPKGSVLSLEPDPFLASLIIKTESNPHPAYAPVSVITAAVSNETGFAVLEVPERSRASNAIIGKSECTQRGGVRQRFGVCVTTADQLGANHPKPSVVKMDVEGSEYDALIGGEKIFSSARPVFLLEVQKKNQDKVTNKLKEWNYRLYPLGASLKPENEVKNAVDDIVAVPNN